MSSNKFVKITGFGTLLLIIFVILVNSMIVVTYDNEYKVVKQFGSIKRIMSESGFSFKIPFIQTASSIPKNIQFYDLPPSDVITSDKKTMIVDCYILWKITDAKLFTQTLNASILNTESRIDTIVYNAIKTTISRMTQEEVIRSRDGVIQVSNGDVMLEDVELEDIATKEEENIKIIQLSNEIKNSIGDVGDQYGIKIVEVKIKKLDLPDENKDAVYTRMITERQNIAAAYTAQGESEAQIIRNRTDKEVSILLSEASAEAEKLMAKGEAEYMKILSNAYNDQEKADFYVYVRALDSAKNSLYGENNTLILSSDSPIAQIFQ